VLLGPEESLRIGRTSHADIAITDDPTMSGVHFIIEYLGEAVRVRDLESRNGLFVNGQQVIEAAVQTGDQIRAGRTFFSVALETAEAGSLEPESVAMPGDETRGPRPSDPTRAEVPPLSAALEPFSPSAGTMYVGNDATVGRLAGGSLARPNQPSNLDVAAVGGASGKSGSDPNDPPTIDASAYNKELRLRQSTELESHLYAVVDGAVGRTLVQEAKGEYLRTETLLASGASPYLAAVAPYLIDVRTDCGFLASWHALLNKNPGILIESQADFDKVLAHLRSIFTRKDERGKQSFFRFYDPNVLHEWLSTCTPQQLTGFFGCLSAVIAGIDSGSRLMRLTRNGDVLNADEVFAP
jgi:pSer/pThr/pTyr-binding forkhead associated (FHA) protein